MAIINEEEVLAKYEGADAIYVLQRRKKLNAFQRTVDFAVCMFTPLTGVFEEADSLADRGTYYLVRKDEEDILVTVNDEEVIEDYITKKAVKKRKNVFVYDGNQFAVAKDLISGKSIFTLNI